MRDIRGPLNGNIKLRSLGTYAYAHPRDIFQLKHPELRERLDARLRGKPVTIFPVEPAKEAATAC